MLVHCFWLLEFKFKVWIQVLELFSIVQILFFPPTPWSFHSSPIAASKLRPSSLRRSPARRAIAAQLFDAAQPVQPQSSAGPTAAAPPAHQPPPSPVVVDKRDPLVIPNPRRALAGLGRVRPRRRPSPPPARVPVHGPHAKEGSQPF
jgi:hypothetical protein